MAEKKKTIELLEKLRLRNYKSAFIYRIAYMNEKRLALRSLYFNLHKQKLDFLKDIENTIEQLKREISPIKDPKLLAFYKRKRCELNNYYLKYKMRESFKRVYEREVKSYKKYKKYLSRVNHACVRELLLSHKHDLKKNLQEMNHTGIGKFLMA
ncbi:hypothetical protein E0K83_01360 [Gramella sp. BOM4]|nr:hypothetical protein [Christiangramia bathymodioli]